uniref:Uncharacterized protein n=1 Tax=Arundo donax TaxID=35708 RepID=A0A0A9ECG1_ARUDO
MIANSQEFLDSMSCGWALLDFYADLWEAAEGNRKQTNFTYPRTEEAPTVRCQSPSADGGLSGRRTPGTASAHAGRRSRRRLGIRGRARRRRKWAPSSPSR